MKPYTIRPAAPGDLGAIMQLYDHSRRLMREAGNAVQWVNGYPSEALVGDDIRLGRSFVVCDGATVSGVFAFIAGRDATYAHIEGGQWEADERPYATLHRIARREGSHGILRACVDWCRGQATSLRIDTHEANRRMMHLVEQCGFRYCGIIYVADGTPRRAYQMLDTQTLCKPLVAYVEQEILPRYAAFDSAHRRDHAERVIGHSLELAQRYGADRNMAYAIAAYHDTGLAEGRERHHLVSAQILLADKALRAWFGESQLQVMAEAVEDHRASAQQEPRSLYGRIVAEADRDIEALQIVRRTVQYGLAHYASLDKEAHYRRALGHLQEKYGEGGYLRLWLPESPNAEGLRELRRLIADEAALRAAFEQIYAEERSK